MQIVYKYPLRISYTTAETLRKWSCSTRYLWNRTLRLRIGLYKRYKIDFKYMGKHGSNRRLTTLRGRYDWLAAVPNSSQQEILRDLDKAFANFYRRVKRGETPGYPRFKNRSQLPRLYFPKQRFSINVDDQNRHYLSVTKIKQPIRIDVDRPYLNHPNDLIVSISLSFNRIWFINILVNTSDPILIKRHLPSIGLDMGVAQTITRSDGIVHQIDNEKIKKIENRIAVLQRRISHKKGSKKGEKKSGHWLKQKKYINKLQSELAHIRQNFNHQTSKLIVDSFDNIVIEDLKIKNMTASAAGTIEKPGSMVKQKSGLNRSILRNGWFQFRTMLEYKSARVGGQVIPIKPQYTSQICSQCGYVDAGNRRTQSEFECKQCGYSINADINAAINILKLSPVGLPGSAR